MKTFFTGDDRITDSETFLKYSVELYNKALNNMNLRIVIKMYEILKGKSYPLFQLYILIFRNGGS